jgi:hypothetical protein
LPGEGMDSEPITRATATKDLIDERIRPLLLMP